jgi:hypothetical protein
MPRRLLNACDVSLNTYDAPVATASPLHPHAASHTLMLALELLDEAATQETGTWPGAQRFSGDVQRLASRVRESTPSTGDDECELVRVERLAVETVRMAHTLAGACRDARMPAVIAAVLAEGAARIAVEVISEDVPWTPVERLSRQARQLIEIEAAQRRVDKAARLVLERARGKGIGSG